jgi:large subunit ribosomal protein L18
MKTNNKIIKRELRRNKIRLFVKGTSIRPRLVVFKSLNYIYAQVIDDCKNITLAQATSKEVKTDKTKTEKSFEVGKLIAKKCLAKNIKTVVFDRAGYKYHGRIKAMADGAREGGLKF